MVSCCHSWFLALFFLFSFLLTHSPIQPWSSVCQGPLGCPCSSVGPPQSQFPLSYSQHGAPPSRTCPQPCLQHCPLPHAPSYTCCSPLSPFVHPHISSYLISPHISYLLITSYLTSPPVSVPPHPPDPCQRCPWQCPFTGTGEGPPAFRWSLWAGLWEEKKSHITWCEA